MTTDTNTDRRETAYSALTVAGRGLIMVMVISALFIQPAAAQTNETDPCAFGPPVPGQDATTDGGDLEVVLVNDISGSLGSDGLQAVKDANHAFIDELSPPEEVGAVSYSGSAGIDHHLTTDYQAVKDEVSAYMQDGRGGGTNTAAGIKNGTTALTTAENADDGATKVMIVLSDGEASDQQEAVDAAEAAKAEGIRIYTVALGDGADTQNLEEIASPGDAYTSDNANLTEIYTEISSDVETIGGELRVETRQLYQPGETHEYDVTEITYLSDNTTEREGVTDEASVTSSNTSILSVNESANTLTATDDANASTWVRVDAEYNGSTGCTNVIVSQPTVENLQLVPGIWRIVAVAMDDTMFALLVATLLAVPAARFTSSFGGLAVGQLVMTIGWLAGYVGFGIAAVSLFVSLFIGLNLAANIDYTAGGVRR